jgi:hypothetical protein
VETFRDLIGPIALVAITVIGGLLLLERRLTRLEAWKEEEDRRQKPKR